MKKGLLPSAYKSAAAAVRHMECTHYLHQSFMLSGNRPTKKSTKEKTSMEEADRPKSMYYYIFPLSVYIGKRRQNYGKFSFPPYFSSAYLWRKKEVEPLPQQLFFNKAVLLLSFQWNIEHLRGLEMQMCHCSIALALLPFPAVGWQRRRRRGSSNT